MIIYDFSAILYQNVYRIYKMDEEINKENLRIRLLDSILNINTKFKDKYGSNIVIALDSSSWRKKCFPNYKIKRKEKREEDKINWKEIHTYFDELMIEFRENLMYKIIKVSDAEGDDIISVLSKKSDEPVLIIGPDKDYSQLHRLPDVEQYCPIKNKFIIFEKDEIPYILFTHIMRGDLSDGIPNILNNKDCIALGIRQKPLKQTYIKEAYDNALENKLESFLEEEKYLRFVENKKLIDFRYIPNDLKEEIISEYENYKLPENNVYKYLVHHNIIAAFLQDIQYF